MPCSDSSALHGVNPNFFKNVVHHLVYYDCENKVLKHRIVHFTQKFESNMVNDVINEDVFNFDRLDENGGFIK